MLTDDDLTRELRSAFREATRDLEYRGAHPRPGPSRPRLLLSAAAAATGVVAAAVLLAAWPSGGDPTASRPGTSTPRVVTDAFELAGFTITYQRGVDEEPLRGDCPAEYVQTGNPDQDPCYVAIVVIEQGAEPPSGATRVQIDALELEGWLGDDPQTGTTTLYLSGASEETRRFFAILPQAGDLNGVGELVEP